ncbi:MAG TPA: hypothetical protein VN692_15775, partial [Steroidobacteraceae bacterium]|nr:hypothetical protein [Steroidobacteraceae bacterium]
MKPCVKAIVLLCCLSAGAAIPAADSRAGALPGVRTDHGTLPPDAPGELKRLVGEYGSAEDRLTIYEAGGDLFADGHGLHQVPLRRLSATRFSAGGAAQ